MNSVLELPKDCTATSVEPVMAAILSFWFSRYLPMLLEPPFDPAFKEVASPPKCRRYVEPVPPISIRPAISSIPSVTWLV